MRYLFVVMLTALAGCSADKDCVSYGAAEAKTGHQYRDKAVYFLTILDPSCPLSRKPDLLKLYEPVKTRLRKHENLIRGSAFEIDLEIARVDRLIYEPVSECSSPDLSDAEVNINRQVSKAMEILIELEQLFGQSSVNGDAI